MTTPTPIAHRLSIAVRAEAVPEGDEPADISRTRFLASDDTLDLYRTRIAQDWLDDGRGSIYAKNPVIGLSHPYRKNLTDPLAELSMGTGEDLEIGDVEPGTRGLFLTVAWDMDDPIAAAVAGKYARKVMHAGSVGFRSEQEIALASLDKAHPWRADRGYMLRGNTLLEFSVGVLIPGNSNALAIRGEDGTGVDADGWLRDALYRTAPAELRDIVAQVLREDPAMQKLLREVAGDMVTTATHAAAVVQRTHPLGWLFRGEG